MKKHNFKILIGFLLFLALIVLGACRNSLQGTWFSGDSSPEAKIGINGDMYLNKETGQLYHKENNAWLKIANITGFSQTADEDEYPLKEAKIINGKLVFTFTNGEVLNAGDISYGSNYEISLTDGVFKISNDVVYHNLDSIALDGLSFREIFLENNLIQDGNLLEDDNTTLASAWRANAGQPTKNTTTYATAPSSLNISGLGSQQLKRDLTPTDQGSLFLASQVKIVSYTAGIAGLFMLANGVNYSEGMITKVTNGFEVAAQIVENNGSGSSLCIGSGNSATLTGFVDSAVALNLTKIFSYIPSLKTMTKLYEVFIKMYNGEENIMTKETYSSLSNERTVISTDEALRAFYAKMAFKAQKLGANIISAEIKDAIGFTPFISMQDMIRIAIIASGYDELAKVWNNPTYTATTLGLKKQFSVSSTVVASSSSHYLTDHYFVLGGKTGTLSNVANLLCLVEGPGGAIFLGMVSSNAKDTATDNRFTKAKILFDIAKAKYLDPKADTSSLESSLTADRACVVVLPPNGNILSYSTYNWFGANSQYHLFSKNATDKMYVASVWKILTVITALDYIDDLDERFMVLSTDLSSSTPDFSGGEIITFRNALYFIMLPSSNTSCAAIARVLGEKIIRESL